jgi:SAM-dependent methyltransferase
MLDTTLKATFVPGTNLKGDVAGANWTFLLPRLELAQIVCIGVLPLTSAVTLSRIGQRVWIVAQHTQQLDPIVQAQRRMQLSNLKLFVADSHAVLPLPSQTSDLVVIAGSRVLRHLQHDRSLLTELRRVLKPDGSLYLEIGGLTSIQLDKQALESVIEYFGGAQLFWLTPFSGEMHTAVPLRDCDTMKYFLNHRLYSPSIKLRGLDRVEHFLNKNRFLVRLTLRYGALARCGASNAIDQPPVYLQTIMREAGLKSTHYRWGLSARGDYNSRKVLFYLFDRTTGSPEYIVKMTRDPAFNFRLENEYRALMWLNQKGIGNRETLPQTVFQGYHGDLAIIGETLIEGVSFKSQTKATADCPYARAGIDWLTHLGKATANCSAATPTQVAERLKILFDRFRELYSLTPEQLQFLTDQIAAIGESVDPFPVVFQHGDPGTWNVLVTPGGRVAFLDWEAAEKQGMPLWDLFYFLRSYSVWVARTQGRRDRLNGFAQQFLAESSLSPLVVESIKRYCMQVGVPGYLVEPLFYTCWMHRALKESTRLPSDELDTGSYIKLLQMCIAQRNASTLKRLFRLTGFR